MESIACPGCQKTIRIPTDVVGQRAQCPFCKCHFRAPTRTADGSLTPAKLIRRNPFAESRTFGPGVALIFVGLLGTLTNAINVARAYSDPEEFARQTREAFEKRGLPNVELTIEWMPVAQIGFLILSGLVVAGGVAMIRRRWHALAMVGSVCALFNVANYCCVLGIPVGGWALYVLMNPEVRGQFPRTATLETKAPPA